MEHTPEYTTELGSLNVVNSISSDILNHSISTILSAIYVAAKHINLWIKSKEKWYSYSADLVDKYIGEFSTYLIYSIFFIKFKLLILILTLYIFEKFFHRTTIRESEIIFTKNRRR